jgi:hypothetical protein
MLNSKLLSVTPNGIWVISDLQHILIIIHSVEEAVL